MNNNNISPSFSLGIKNLANFCSLILLTFSLQAQTKFSCQKELSFDLAPTTGKVYLSPKLFFKDQTGGLHKPISQRLEISNCKNPKVFDGKVPNDSLISLGVMGTSKVRLWAKYTNENWAFCDTKIDVQNNMGAPSEGNCPIEIDTFNGQNVVLVRLNGGTCDFWDKIIKAKVKTSDMSEEKIYSLTKGSFKVPIPPNGLASLSLSFYAENANPLDGVTTFDIVLIHKHILGIQPINNKFLLIAADINNNGKVTMADIVELRKMIVGFQTDFKNNSIYRFFDKNLNEDIILKNVNTPQILDVYSIKIGDINSSSSAASCPK